MSRYIYLFVFLIFSTFTKVKTEESNKNLRFCTLLPQYRHVEVICTSPKETIGHKCADAEIVGTIAIYNCKANHIPFEGTIIRGRSLTIENFLKCNAKGEWSGIRRYKSYRCKEDCGKLTTNAKPLIINGVSSNRTQYPWHATIFRRHGNTWKYICGGSIIRNQVILSAAHCFAIDHNHVINPNEYRILLGAVSSNYNANLMRDGVQKHEVNRIKVSENYDPKKGYQADIAVVQLQDNIEYNDNVAPVCLPNDYNTDVNAVRAGITGQIAGFGITEHGDISEELRSIHLRINSNSECYSSLKWVLSESQFCGGDKNGTHWETLCNGDSGGGLSFASSVHQKYHIHGIVSSGDPNTNHGICNNFAVFTRVYPFIFWIRDIVEEITGEIARDLRQNVPYPYALRGTETQFVLFNGLPREWLNRITSLEIIYAEINIEILLDALENAKPIHNINLENVIFTTSSKRMLNRHVVLPLLSSFSLDLISENHPKFNQISEERKFPIRISETYLKSLLFFNKDFETVESNWSVESLLNLNMDIDLTVSIFKILSIHIKRGYLKLQQMEMANKIIDGYKRNPEFKLNILALHKVNIDLNKIEQFQFLTELTLDNITFNSNNIKRQSSIFGSLPELKILVFNPNYNSDKYALDLNEISQSIEHISVSAPVELILSTTSLKFTNLRTLCCMNCEISEEILNNFSTIFPNLSSLVIKSAKEIIIPQNSNLKSYYWESSTTNSTFSLNIYLNTGKSYSIAPSEYERQHIFYNCNRQQHFWSSETEYSALTRLKTFEKESLRSNKYVFRGSESDPITQNLEIFQGIPSCLQNNLESIMLKSVDISTTVLVSSIEKAKNLKSLKLINCIIDVSHYKYKRVENQTLEIRLEEIQLIDFKLKYALEYIDGQLNAVVIPRQDAKSWNSMNVLHRLFTKVNAIRLEKNLKEWKVYDLDSTVLEVLNFSKVLMEIIKHLPSNHPIKEMSKEFVELHIKYIEVNFGPNWKLTGLHVIDGDIFNWFYRDDFLKVLNQSGMLSYFIRNVGEFFTLERSSSLNLNNKNPYKFPLIHVVAVNSNEDIIE